MPQGNTHTNTPVSREASVIFERECSTRRSPAILRDIARFRVAKRSWSCNSLNAACRTTSNNKEARGSKSIHHPQCEHQPHRKTTRTRSFAYQHQLINENNCRSHSLSAVPAAPSQQQRARASPQTLRGCVKPPQPGRRRRPQISCSPREALPAFGSRSTRPFPARASRPTTPAAPEPSRTRRPISRLPWQRLLRVVWPSARAAWRPAKPNNQSKTTDAPTQPRCRLVEWAQGTTGETGGTRSCLSQPDSSS